LYERLHKEGHDISKISKLKFFSILAFCFLGFSEKGSLWVAQTSDRLHTLKRQYSIIKALGINCEILSVEKLKEKVPIIDPHEIWV
jgi:L-2-hydroxyglutarate oxidase LhgO